MRRQYKPNDIPPGGDNGELEGSEPTHPDYEQDSSTEESEELAKYKEAFEEIARALDLAERRGEKSTIRPEKKG